MSNDSGPAFPVVGQMYGDKLGGQLYHGMTLRDYLAAKAMQTINPEKVVICDSPEGYARLAVHCYRMADAMLEKRKEA